MFRFTASMGPSAFHCYRCGGDVSRITERMDDEHGGPIEFGLECPRCGRFTITMDDSGRWSCGDIPYIPDAFSDNAYRYATLKSEGREPIEDARERIALLKRLKGEYSDAGDDLMVEEIRDLTVREARRAVNLGADEFYGILLDWAVGQMLSPTDPDEYDDLEEMAIERARKAPISDVAKSVPLCTICGAYSLAHTLGNIMSKRFAGERYEDPYELYYDSVTVAMALDRLEMGTEARAARMRALDAVASMPEREGKELTGMILNELADGAETLEERKELLDRLRGIREHCGYDFVIMALSYGIRACRIPEESGTVLADMDYVRRHCEALSSPNDRLSDDICVADYITAVISGDGDRMRECANEAMQEISDRVSGGFGRYPMVLADYYDHCGNEASRRTILRSLSGVCSLDDLYFYAER